MAKTLCLPGNVALFCRLLIFVSKSTFLKNSFRNTIRVSNSLDPDQTRHVVGSDLGPNCLQILSADDTSRQRVEDQTLGVCKGALNCCCVCHCCLWNFLTNIFGTSLSQILQKRRKHLFLVSVCFI